MRYRFKESRRKRRLLSVLLQVADRTMQRVARCCACCGSASPPNENQGDDSRQDCDYQANQLPSNGRTMSCSNPWQRIEDCPTLLRELAESIEDCTDLAVALESAGLLLKGNRGTDDVDFPKQATPILPSELLKAEDRLKFILNRIPLKDEESYRRFKRTLIENGEFKAVDILQSPKELSSSTNAVLPTSCLWDTEFSLGQNREHLDTNAGEEPPGTPLVGAEKAWDMISGSSITATVLTASEEAVPNHARQASVQYLSEEGVRDLLHRVASLDDDNLRRFRRRIALENATCDPIQLLHDVLQYSLAATQSEQAQPIVDPLPKYIGPQKSRQSEPRLEFMQEEVDARVTPLGAVVSTSTQSRTDEQVQVRAAERLVPGGPHVYSMAAHPRGLCVIFNIRRFPGLPHRDRPGSDFDEERMVRLFQAFNFNVCSHVDPTSTDILSLLETYATLNVQESHDAFVCIIMSHGEQQHIYGSDDSTVKLQTIFELFNNNGCPAMRERPKIFLIQACRGYVPDNGSAGRRDEQQRASSSSHQQEELAKVLENIGLDDNEEETVDTVQSDAGVIGGTLPRSMVGAGAGAGAEALARQNPERRIPSWSDMYIAYAVIEGYESLRDSTTGSWFLKAVFDVMARESHRYDLDTLMDRVTKKVIERSRHDGQRQCPEIRKIGWHKKLFFNPGL